jgi:hypothetical protein
MPCLTVSASDQKFWHQVFKAINWYYWIDWIHSRGKYYYNCSNIWYDADIQKMILNGVVPCHPDRACEGNHECYGPDIYGQIVVDEFEYVFSGNIGKKFCETIIDDQDEDEYDDQDEDLIHPTVRQIVGDPRDIKFVADADVTIVNNCGINEDHRGANHTLLYLPFVESVSLGREFTFFDLLTANSNLKSHKFDYNYEMFCKAFINEQGQVELEFDHGS